MKKYSFIGAGLIAVVLAAVVFWPGGEPVQEQLRDGLYDIRKSIFWSGTEEPVEKYGIDIGDLYMCTDVIKPNQNLSELLGENGIPVAVVHELVDKSHGLFDVRKIQPGKSYCLMRSSDSLDQVKYFIYEQDPINYVVYEIGDSLSVRTGSKKVDIYEREVSGLISSSLWNTLTSNDIDPQVAISLSEIYAWSIDFFRLQKGDYFKVIFDEQFVEGRRVGIGEVRGAYFNHQNKEFYAVKYEQDSVAGYYDENAKSLRSAFLKAPLAFRRISSNFNRARFHPILKRSRPHLGTDYAAETGTPIWAIGAGVVTEAKFGRGTGNYVEIKHNGTYTTKYLHMSKFGPGIKPGTRVSQGQVIGYVGSTGLATGPHLHFEMIKNGQHTDATKEDLPHGEPIKTACIDSYKIYSDQIIAKLKAIPHPTDFEQSKEAESSESIETNAI